MPKQWAVLFLALLGCVPPPTEAAPLAAPTKPPGTRVPIARVAGYVVRTDGGEVVVDVPRERAGTRHVHVVGVALDAPRVPSLHLPDGPVNGGELLGALSSSAWRTETRGTEQLVLLEGRPHPREDAREIDLRDAVLLARITRSEWTRAVAEYETRLARDLSFELQARETDHARAARAIAHVEAPLRALVRPADASLLEVVRFWSRKRRELACIAPQRAGTALARWTRDELAEPGLESAFTGRSQPTNAERDAYRELFAYAGTRLLAQTDDGEEALDTRCFAAREAARVLDVFDARAPRAAQARELAAECP